MNRRGFLNSILKAGVAAMVLPSALTYERKWKKVDGLWVVNPSYKDAEFEVLFVFNPSEYMGEWKFINPTLLRPAIRYRFQDGNYIAVPELIAA